MFFGRKFKIKSVGRLSSTKDRYNIYINNKSLLLRPICCIKVFKGPHDVLYNTVYYNKSKARSAK